MLVFKNLKMVNLLEDKRDVIVAPVNKIKTTGEIGRKPLDIKEFSQEDYMHRIQLEVFFLEQCSNFEIFSKNVNDYNFRNVTNRLKPAETYLACRYPIYGEVNGQQIISFMEEGNFLFTGAQGLTLVYSIDKSFFFRGVLTVSFDYEKKLFLDRIGQYQVPGIYRDPYIENPKLITENFNKSYDEGCELLLMKKAR